jgi:hypothetical protein
LIAPPKLFRPTGNDELAVMTFPFLHEHGFNNAFKKTTYVSLASDIKRASRALGPNPIELLPLCLDFSELYLTKKNHFKGIDRTIRLVKRM